MRHFLRNLLHLHFPSDRPCIFRSATLHDPLNIWRLAWSQKHNCLNCFCCFRHNTAAAEAGAYVLIEHHSRERIHMEVFSFCRSILFFSSDEKRLHKSPPFFCARTCHPTLFRCMIRICIWSEEEELFKPLPTQKSQLG